MSGTISSHEMCAAGLAGRIAGAGDTVDQGEGLFALLLRRAESLLGHSEADVLGRG